MMRIAIVTDAKSTKLSLVMTRSRGRMRYSSVKSVPVPVSPSVPILIVPAATSQGFDVDLAVVVAGDLNAKVTNLYAFADLANLERGKTCQLLFSIDL